MDTIETDAVIIGAGPCGLFAVFELGMLSIQCHVIDILDKPGGQCSELYPEKPIYDIPAIPAISGQQLTDSLLAQSAPFKPHFHFNTRVTRLTPNGDGRWQVVTDQNTRFLATAVIIAAGAGSFTPRKVPVPHAEKYSNRGILYSVRQPEQFAEKRLVIAGGGDSALDWTLNLVDRAAHITLVHRRKEFSATPDTVAKVMHLVDQGRLDFEVGSISGLQGNDQLSAVEVRGTNGLKTLPCDHLLAFYGLIPQLDDIASFGLDMRDGQITADTEQFQSSLPGVYAIGDIASYPGKLKLILSGFHEAALMAQSVARRVRPDARQVFQHSTTAMKQRMILEN